ncbi:MAG TPA: right-handed parallel beta-helix repeat-containing protein [Gaiellaceae bacterium]|nr:right-handed parallel beta-helix repeat-containing protein [Gaiellaceae bacterium]
MSYTLRGRIESRVAALLLPLFACCAASAALRLWWPLELCALMAAVGIALDLQLYHHLFRYQPGWLALPLGLLELGLMVALVRLLGLEAPLVPALLLFAAAWAVAQVLGHAGFPLARLSYATDGGELGRFGIVSVAALAATLASAGGYWWWRLPPVVHLSSGVHRGPLVIDRRMKLVGERGAVVRGGIVVRANGVTIENVTVVGGENGVTVDGVDDVTLDGVSVSGFALDGIHVRRAAVTIENCRVDALGNRWAQGVDISYGGDKRSSHVMGCTIVGGQEGIATHFVNVDLMGNHVSRTTLRGIAMTEMSMGMIEDNQVQDASGIGILCNDHSMCMIDKNTVVGTHRVPGSEWTGGYGVLVSYGSEAEVGDNALAANPRTLGAIVESTIRRR